MRFTKRTFYTLGVVAAVLSVAGSAFLLLGQYMGILYTVSSIAASAMMLFIIPKLETSFEKITALAGSLCALFAMMGGAVSTPSGFIAAVCGAAAWPIFSLAYRRDTACENGENIRTCANLVMLAGAIQLVGTFIAIPDTIRICLAIAIGLCQGAFAWVLRNSQLKT